MPQYFIGVKRGDFVHVQEEPTADVTIENGKGPVKDVYVTDLQGKEIGILPEIGLTAPWNIRVRPSPAASFILRVTF